MNNNIDFKLNNFLFFNELKNQGQDWKKNALIHENVIIHNNEIFLHQGQNNSSWKFTVKKEGMTN